MPIGKKSGITMTMLIIYIMVLVVIMGAVILNIGNNGQVDELEKATYQARIIDYMEQFTSMKEFYDIRGEYNYEILIKDDEKDIYGRTISDYIPSITSDDKEYLCIYEGVLSFYGIDQDNPRYNYLTELGLELVEMP